MPRLPNPSEVFNPEQHETLERAGFTIRPALDSERWERLREAYAASGLWAGQFSNFCCSDADECRKKFQEWNHPHTISDQYRGTFAGPFAAYDLLYKGNPLRVCVVSRDSGEKVQRSEIDERIKTALKYLDKPVEKRSQHWVGTLELINLLFFDKHPIGGELPFDQPLLFAHVRAIKCTWCGKQGEGSRWFPPDQMYKNCVRHLQAELNALEPTLIIAQGYKMDWSESNPCTTWSVVRAMEGLSGAQGRDVYASLIPASPTRKRLVAKCWGTHWGSCVLLGTYHPCAGKFYNARGVGARDAELRPAICSLKLRKFAQEFSSD